MEKGAFRTYLNNSIAMIIFSLLKTIFFRKSNTSKDKKNILFINSGQIGDLIVSSLFFQNDHFFNRNSTIYFVLKNNYSSIYKNHSSRIIIIPYSYLKYKWNLFYKFKFIRKLRKLNIDECINLTSARGILNDEMALLAGANKTYCLNSNWKYLKKAFGKRIDSMYDEVLCSNVENEYDKQKLILYRFSNKKFNNLYDKLFKTKNKFEHSFPKEYRKKIICVAPFASDNSRAWNISKYNELINMLLSDFTVILIGSKKEKNIFKFCVNNNIINLIGNINLEDIPSVINLSDVFIGNDSGLTHISIKLQKKTIAIIGGGNYGKFLPVSHSENHVRYLFYRMECFGCEWKCIHREKYCLSNISVDNVIENIKSVFKEF